MKTRRPAEVRLREEMLASHERLLRGEISKDLLRMLQERFPETFMTAFIIDVIPEQAEDLYTLLLDRDTIVRIELPRVGAGLLYCRQMTVREYEKESGKLPRPERRKLEMARHLIVDLNGSESPDPG